MTRKYFGIEIPKSVTCTPNVNRGVIFTDGKGCETRFEQRGFNVWRAAFDSLLSEKAVESGAELRDETVAVSCDEAADLSSVSVTFKGKNKNEYTEAARFVIDCGGVTSRFKQKLTGVETDFIKTFQTFNYGKINLCPDYFYAYLQPELSEYDAWFNVKDDMLVLGVAVKSFDSAAHFYESFTEYMRRRHGLEIEKQLKEDKWLMPRIKPGCNITYGSASGKVLFAGETAGFLNPMGEGISAAMESGFCAACAVEKSFDFPHDAVRNYKSGAEPLRAYMTRQWSFAARMADTFSEML